MLGKRSRGLTLLEVMVSLSMLILSTLSILSLCIYSAKLGKQSEARATALSIARSQIDQILAVSQSNRTPVSNEEIDIPSDLKSQMPGKDLKASYSIKQISGSSNLQVVEVTVKWRNATGNLEAPFTTVSASKTISSTEDMSWNKYDGWTPHNDDDFFYTPPPPKPPTTSTTGGTTGSSSTSSSTTGSSSSTSSTTTGSSTSSSTTGSSSSGSSTGSSSTGSSTTSSTTGSSTGSAPVSGFTPGSGSKWK